MILIPILGNSGKSDEADVIEIERPRDFVVIDLCDNRDKHKQQLALSHSPSDGDDDDAEELANLIQDARQKGGRREGEWIPRGSHSQTQLAKDEKAIRFRKSLLVLQFQGFTV